MTEFMSYFLRILEQKTINGRPILENLNKAHILNTEKVNDIGRLQQAGNDIIISQDSTISRKHLSMYFLDIDTFCIENISDNEQTWIVNATGQDRQVKPGASDELRVGENLQLGLTSILLEKKPST